MTSTLPSPEEAAEGVGDAARILAFAPQVPWPPRQGAAIRNFFILRALARRHRVTLLAFGDPEQEPGPLEASGIEVVPVVPPEPRSGPRRALDLATTATPDLARRLASETMLATARLKAVLQEPYDVIQLEGLEMAPYALDVLQATPAGRRARLIYDAHNAEWVLQRRAYDADLGDRRRWVAALYSLVQTLKLRRYEGRVLRAAHTTVAVSEVDAAALRSLEPQARIVVAANGVDTRFFSPGAREEEDPDLVVFTGKMDFRPNVDAVQWFCDEVWPGVLAERPTARFAIVGRDPSPAVRHLASRPGVLVTGEVADVRPWLIRSGVVVAPLRVGGGTRLKVLEALSMSKALVATSMAIDGLELTPGRDLVVADAPGEMGASVLELAADEERRRALGEAGRRRAEFQYQWEQVGWQLEALIRRNGSLG